MKKSKITESNRDKLVDIILKVAMQHHDDVSESDEDAACDATDEILKKFPQINYQYKDFINPFKIDDGNCYYCNKPTNSLVANPSEWSVKLCHKEEPGKVKHHHISCVMQRLDDFEKLKELHKMQAELLHNNVAFWGSDYNDKNEFVGIKFCIICNDVFAWGTADAESVGDDELQFVYDIYKKYKEVGIDAWCSLKRNKLEPQQPYLEENKDFHKIRDEIEKMKMKGG